MMLWSSGTILARDVSFLPASRLINRNVIAGNGCGSMRLEPEPWDALLEIRHREATDLHGLIRHIDAIRNEGGRTSAARVLLLTHLRTAAAEGGRAAAGHGPCVEQRAAA